MSFAVGCGLHQMCSDIAGRPRPGSVLLPPPESLADYLERVNIFSSVFQVRRPTTCTMPVRLINISTPQIERQACLESGVPLTLADEASACAPRKLSQH